MTSEILYSSHALGPIVLKNRVVMAPMTRSRSEDGVPTNIMATYYAQRAEAGLIVTEGTSPSPNGLGYARIPGLYNEAQVSAWRKVTDAVHTAGSKIFVQLMHTGRISHALNMPKGAQVLAPSAVVASGQMYTDASGMQPHTAPVAMSASQIESTIEEYASSARLALKAGFDGVELHGANGYLIEQFLNTATNQRNDEWGGSPDNRIRFALEVAKRVVAAIGAERVGFRLSPYNVFNGSVSDADTDTVYLRLTEQLSMLGLAYLHVLDHSSQGAPKPKASLIRDMRLKFAKTFISTGGYDAARATADLLEKRADLIGFGRPFLANPKLVSALKSGVALKNPDQSTLYTPGPKGYVDYE